jgi:uncharacterized membrane protein (UPF0182 family)
VVKPKSDIPPDLLAHMRYPEDMFKVQRDILADYHVQNPTTFFSQNDQWSVPTDPTNKKSTTLQPPYRLSVATQTGGNPVFSLTSVYTPSKKQNLAAFVSVGADPTDTSTYGKFQILRLPDTTQVPGPSQMANQFISDDKVANRLQAFKRVGADVTYGNLLTLPLGGGLLYVQPIYTSGVTGEGTYPKLSFVVVSFGDDVGIGSTLTAALDDLGTGTGSTPSTPTTKPPAQNPPAKPSTKPHSSGTKLPAQAIRLLQRADAKFAQAETALKSGDLATYAKRVDEGRKLVEKALAAGR